MQYFANSSVVRIGLNAAERDIITQGGIVGDRVSPFDLDAKTDVRSLETHYGAPDAEQRFQAGRAIARLFTDEDVVLYLPQSTLESSSIMGIVIPPERLFGRDEDDYVQHQRARLPSMGYMVAFDF